jgi:hydrogenase expression/formation protein HypE
MWRNKVNIGKISNKFLQDRIFSRLKTKRSDVLLGPGVGRDCSVVDFGDEVCILSSDPITGAANQIGYIGVHICCNDIATTGAEIIGVTLTLLVPPSTTTAHIEQVIIDAERAAEELDIDILGGHTEITDSVTKMVLSLTAVGRIEKERVVSFANARVGDQIIVTKKAGMEGTAILAYDMAQLLEPHFSPSLIETARSFLNEISVVKEGKIAGLLNAHGMHDATEGGVLGALWELAEAMGKGVEVELTSIPVASETRAICNFFNIDPLKLISSGCMVIVASDGLGLVNALNNNGIEATIVGEVIDGKEKWLIHEGSRIPLEPPQSDHLYKALQNAEEL